MVQLLRTYCFPVWFILVSSFCSASPPKPLDTAEKNAAAIKCIASQLKGAKAKTESCHNILGGLEELVNGVVDANSEVMKAAAAFNRATSEGTDIETAAATAMEKTGAAKDAVAELNTAIKAAADAASCGHTQVESALAKAKEAQPAATNLTAAVKELLQQTCDQSKVLEQVRDNGCLLNQLLKAQEQQTTDLLKAIGKPEEVPVAIQQSLRNVEGRVNAVHQTLEEQLPRDEQDHRVLQLVAGAFPGKEDQKYDVQGLMRGIGLSVAEAADRTPQVVVGADSAAYLTIRIPDQPAKIMINGVPLGQNGDRYQFVRIPTVVGLAHQVQITLNGKDLKPLEVQSGTHTVIDPEELLQVAKL